MLFDVDMGMNNQYFKHFIA